MNLSSLLTQQSIGCLMTLMAGSIGLVANPGMAQPALEKNLPLQMAQSASLVGSWQLVNMTESGTPTPMVPPQATALTADFSADGRISGSGGCNRFMGGYTTEGDQLNIGPLASTFKACEEPIMNQESRYLKALQGAQRYEVNNEGLQIFYKTAQESGVLRFTAQAVRGLW